MKAKNIRDLNRRKFDGDWDQVDYCYRKARYWFYARRKRARASKFCRTLEPVLKKVANKHETIMGEECWSLLYEVRGDLDKAILYRRNEIRLIRRFQRFKTKFKHYGPDDVPDRLILLGILYKEANDIRQAIKAVREARRICTRNRIKFGSSDLLSEYETEFRGRPVAPRRAEPADVKGSVSSI